MALRNSAAAAARLVMAERTELPSREESPGWPERKRQARWCVMINFVNSCSPVSDTVPEFDASENPNKQTHRCRSRGRKGPAKVGDTMPCLTDSDQAGVGRLVPSSRTRPVYRSPVSSTRAGPSRPVWLPGPAVPPPCDTV